MDRDLEETLIMRLMEQLEKMDSRLDNIDKTLMKQNMDIEYHIKRTDALEDQVQLTKKDLEPIKKHVIQLDGVLKFIGIIGMILGVIGGALKLSH